MLRLLSSAGLGIALCVAAACGDDLPITPDAGRLLYVGGTVEGLLGEGLVLESSLGDTLEVRSSGQFLFPTQVAPGTPVTVEVADQPTGPSQVCVVRDDGRTSTQDDVTMTVRCGLPSFVLGGNTTGLEGSGLVVENEGTETLGISGNGPFAFDTLIQKGESYTVSIDSQPTAPTQTCTLMGGSGTVVFGDVTSISINCTTNTYFVGGTVSGLGGAGLVLTNNDGDDLAISANGEFAFATPVPSGQTYEVAVKSQPTSPWQTCTVSAPTGTITNANVSDISISCTTNTYTVGGTVTGLTLPRVLRNNGGDDLSINADGSFVFATPIASGASFSVSAAVPGSEPWQDCTVSAGEGTVTDSHVSSVSVTCDPLQCSNYEWAVGSTAPDLIGPPAPFSCPSGATHWCASTPISPTDGASAKAACEACFGAECIVEDNDCAGAGYRHGTDTQTFGYVGSGCSSEPAGRVWQFGTSYQYYGTWMR